MKKKIEALRPGDWVVTKTATREVQYVTCQKDRNWGGSTFIVNLGGDDVRGREGSLVDIAPHKPQLNYIWDNAEQCYVITIESEGDLQIIVNGEDVYGHTIRVHSERVSELETP